MPPNEIARPVAAIVDRGRRAQPPVAARVAGEHRRRAERHGGERRVGAHDDARRLPHRVRSVSRTDLKLTSSASGPTLYGLSGSWSNAAGS